MSPVSSDTIVAKHKDECAQAAAAFKRDMQKLRTGRASPSMLEGIQVDYYGTRTPLKALGQLTAPEPRLLVIQVFDASAAPAVEKAIQTAALGLNPSREGNVIRVSIPSLTEESRKDLVRHLHKMAEEMRVSIRSHRRDANELIKKAEKDGDLTKDDAKRVQDKIQKQTDAAIAEIDALLKTKEAECLEV